MPERARAYLITDDQVARQAARYAGRWPDPGAAGPPGSAQTPEPGTGPWSRAPGRPRDRAKAALSALWAALWRTG